jgi:hypothetical protein
MDKTVWSYRFKLFYPQTHNIVSNVHQYYKHLKVIYQLICAQKIESYKLFVVIRYEGGSKRFWPDQLFKVTEIKQTLLFSNIVSLYFNTYWYINLIIDVAIYPSQHYPFGAAFVCQTGDFWTHPRTFVQWLEWCCLILNNDKQHLVP